MKNIFKKYSLLCVVVVSAVSCSYLDKQPDNLRTFDMIWESRADAEAYLYHVYGYIWTVHDDFTALGVSDETSCPLGGTYARHMIEGRWGPSLVTWDYWGRCYNAIRASLVFDANIDRVPDDKVSQELRTQYKAESKFLRGWFYWQLLRMYGPFVIIDRPLSPNEDYSSFVRAPFDKCVEYVCRLMDQAGGELPVDWTSPSNYGRPTRGACLAVISQVRLLAASELWNGNPRFADFKNEDGTTLAPQGAADPEKWKLACEAAREVIYLDTYRLYRNNVDGGDVTFDPYLSCRDVFLSDRNREIVFASCNAGDGWIWGYEKRCAPMPGGYAMQNATQNIVDAFYTRKGLDINDDPDYTEAGFVNHDDPEKYGMQQDAVNRGYLIGESNMYANREPRFYAAVQYNGKPVLSASNIDEKNYYSSSNNKDGTGRAEFYYSGMSGAKARNSTDMTGYNVLKKISPASNIRTDKTHYKPFLHIRYAEILLNYIEALNEYDPGHRDIITYFNELRDRAGVPSIAATYPEEIGDRDRMRARILRERQIELAFEGDRYWTLCRRLLFENPEYRTIGRLNVNADDGGQGFVFADFYKRMTMPVRFWDNRMYLFPIYQNEIDRGRGLVQNPGWDNAVIKDED